MNSYLYPPLLFGSVGGVVAEEVQDSPSDGQSVFLSITKDLQLRVQTDRELRTSIEMLIEEMKEMKELLMLMQGVS